jgi:hypothetical protein
MIAIHEDLLEVLDAVKIESARRYVVLGESRDVPESDAAQVSGQAGVSGPVQAIARDVYDRLYVRPLGPASWSHAELLASREMVAGLSAANTGRGTWESGWAVRRIEEDGQVVVSHDGIDFWVSVAGLRVADGKIWPGAGCRVKLAKELRGLSHGFYMALGDEDEDADGGEATEPIVRYYWHLTSRAAVPFIATATSLLNAARIPFRAKVLSDPEAYHRADAGVLYIRRCFQGRAGPIITRIYSSVSPHLRAQIPLFTKWLARGLGFAEDPAGPVSFGEHRCQLVASALWESFQRHETDREARVSAVAEVFARQGLDPLRPHRGPNSSTQCDPEPLDVDPGLQAVDNSSVMRDGTDSRGSACAVSTPPLTVAWAIGRSLCASAIWDDKGQLCNWMGRSADEFVDDDGLITPTSAALRADLYAGSAGVALFLAQIHAHCGDAESRRTALGAIHRSIHQLDGAPRAQTASALSYFLGDLGVAWAARTIGILVGEAEVVTCAQGVFNQIAESCSQPHVLDLLGGSAGAIPALLAVGRTPGLGHCLEVATLLGEELCRSARRQGNTCTWDPVVASGPGMASIPLTGLSHGAAGIGLALFELYAATGRQDFLETARGAFAYEDSIFDAERGNWPDLRTTQRRDTSDSRGQFATGWCHGAPGIALARLRASVLDPIRANDYLATAQVALGTTFAAIDENLASTKADATLCHGLAGLLEIVLVASQITGEPSYRNRAAAVAQLLIDRHAESGDWSSGAPSGGRNPSFMLGTAGIGYTFLRLHNPGTVPSVLLFTP